MDELLTATDLDQWSPTQQARAHLPSLIRATVMASVAPDSIRFPAAEGVDEPGFDALIEVAGGAPPYVPAGRSVWEIGTGGDIGRKAGSDYLKRTRAIPAAQRRAATFVFVTSRRWPGKDAWVERRVARGDWAAVQAYDAADLALWLETVPGVRARFSELLGRQPYGLTPLTRWAADWRDQTEPALPLELLLAGRRPQARRLAAALVLEPGGQQLVAAPSRDEGVAFLAVSLLSPRLDDDPGDGQPVTTEGEPAAPLPEPGPDEAGAALTTTAPAGRGELPGAAQREAVAERTLVVHDEAGWRRAVSYDHPVVLVPLFDDPNVTAALRAGHSVVVARRARSGDDALPPLHRTEARQASERLGLGHGQADALARSARRSLTSLRRRISRGRAVRPPAWAEGASASVLAPLLLAGTWRDDVEGDREAVAELADRQTWRTLARDLMALRSAEDAPLAERDHRWQFVDVVDAWDALADTITSDDLDSFHRLAESVLTEPDPAAALTAAERQRRSLSLEGLPTRRYSTELRHGLADTAALLGAVLGERRLGGGRTGQQHADQLVFRLLHDADADRWIVLSEVLPLLAEAAPSVFLDALDQSLRQHPAPVMALFAEQPDLMGTSWSRHSHLLWSLESLAYGPQHLSRVVLALARLAALDPGGTLANRPAASLHDALHLAMPRSAVAAPARLAILDRVRTAEPAVGWTLMLDLVRSLDRAMMLRTGPRRRNWPVPDRTTIDIAEVVAAVNDLAEQLAQDATSDAARWAELADRIDRFPVAGRDRLLDTLTQRWEQLPASGAAEIAKRVAERIAQHEQHPQAKWALPADQLERLRGFVTHRGAPTDPAEELRSLFSYRPRQGGRDLFRDRDLLISLQQDTLREVLTDGLPAVLELAASVQQPWALGATLAAVTGEHDQDVLDLIGRADPAAHQLAAGLVAHRHASSPSWLAETVQARPGQAGALLLLVEVSPALLDLVGRLGPTVAAEFWRTVSPWRVRGDAVEPAAAALLAHDRPYSALAVLSDVGTDRAAPFPAELAVRALKAPISGSSEGLEVIDSAAYVIGLLLDRLEQAGVDAGALADLEWFYLPLLDDQRPPRALYTRLATDPAFFAEIVSLVYRSDSDLAEPAAVDPGGTAAEADASEPDPLDAPLADIDDAAEESRDSAELRAQLSTVAWTLLHGWHAPLPGAAKPAMIPATAPVAGWVDAARAELAARQRTTIASAVIGQALSGAVTDADGTWPSLPIREVLEREQDARLEGELAIGRFNHRGVTMRSPYSGGQQERDLAARYQGWADRVRDTWPRAGAVLDRLARDYLTDAQREDAAAARTSDR